MWGLVGNPLHKAKIQNTPNKEKEKAIACTC
jgi:hypothetical protein